MSAIPVFPLCYAPPIQWYVEALKYPEIRLERCENYVKQSYRNRAEIASPNGKLSLIIPIQHGKREHTPYTQVQIYQLERWQRIHWMSLETCYRTSPYFEFYEDDLKDFYTQNFTHLFDFNLEMLKTLNKLLKLDIQILFTESYQKIAGKDYRNTIHPKLAEDTQIRYTQVFEAKQGFVGNLSVFDLLFNKGPQSLQILNAAMQNKI
jgi:hypothetical protein